MRVLVTGAAGSIGRVLTPGLVDRGHEVVGLDLVPEPEGFDGPGTPATAPTPDAVVAVFAEPSRSTPSSTSPATPARPACPTR